MLTIGITGGTGLVGMHLTKLFNDKGYKTIVFTRSRDKKSTGNVSYAYWNPDNGECDTNALQNMDVVIHLAGAGVADKRWTDARKKEILDSRVKGAQFLVAQLKAHAPNCRTMIGVSGIGYYGADKSNTPPFTEDMQPANDFLSNVCVQWEQAEMAAASFLRTVIFRIGIVLGNESGAYPELTKPMAFGIVPILSSGKQMVSWIHIDDLCRMMLYAIEHDNMQGTYNAVGHAPVTHKTLMKTIAKEKGGIKIPVPVPAFVLKIMLGEMSTEVLKSATVSANKILATGFTFKYNTLDSAVHALES